MQLPIIDMHVLEAALRAVFCVDLKHIARLFQIARIPVVNPAVKILILAVIFFQRMINSVRFHERDKFIALIG